MMKIMIMRKRMMIMKGGKRDSGRGGAGAGRRSSADPRWAADLIQMTCREPRYPRLIEANHYREQFSAAAVMQLATCTPASCHAGLRSRVLA